MVFHFARITRFSADAIYVCKYDPCDRRADGDDHFSMQLFINAVSCMAYTTQCHAMFGADAFG